MTIEEYIPRALSFESPRPITIVNALHPNLNWARLTHSALGLATEAIELRLATTLENQLEELGDIAWFAALAHDAVGQPPCELTYNEPTTIAHLMALCELWASRIKAGLFYGYTSKETDSSPDAWTYIPMRILRIVQALSIEHTRGALLESNIAKLEARYKKKQFDAAEAQVRDTDGEMKAMTEKLGELPKPPEVTVEEIAKAVVPDADEPSLEDMISFTVANSKTGQIKLGN